MFEPSTTSQSFSYFVALNRADLTHEPKEAGSSWVVRLVIAGVVLVAVLRLIAAGL